MGIHVTALVDPTAQIHESAAIGAFSVIGPRVVIGADTYVGTHCVLGGPPEHREHWHSWNYGVQIGDRCYISNHVTIDAGTAHDTIVDHDCIILRHAHCGHDSVIGYGTVLSCNVLVGGHTIVMPYANLGLGSIVHQNHLVGAGAMLGMGCVVPKSVDIVPGNIYVGNPAKLLKPNKIGLERAGISGEQLLEYVEQWQKLKSQR